MKPSPSELIDARIQGVSRLARPHATIDEAALKALVQG